MVAGYEPPGASVVRRIMLMCTQVCPDGTRTTAAAAAVVVQQSSGAAKCFVQRTNASSGRSRRPPEKDSTTECGQPAPPWALRSYW